MSFYEELLSRGQHLYQEDRYALYKYLLESNRNRYMEQISILMKEGSLNSFIANGEIAYAFSDGCVSYSTKMRGDGDLQRDVRRLRITSFPLLRIKKLMNFFAQAEVDVIWNFPISGSYQQGTGSFCVNAYPYYDLNYYSNGQGKLIGFMKKMRVKENETLEKLKAS